MAAANSTTSNKPFCGISGSSIPASQLSMWSREVACFPIWSSTMSQWHVVERGAELSAERFDAPVCTGDRFARLARDLVATKSVWLDCLVAALMCRFFTSGFRCAARRADLSMTMKLSPLRAARDRPSPRSRPELTVEYSSLAVGCRHWLRVFQGTLLLNKGVGIETHDTHIRHEPHVSGKRSDISRNSVLRPRCWYAAGGGAPVWSRALPL